MGLCGIYEPCFRDGTEAWGHCGGYLCINLIEAKQDGEITSFCKLTNEAVDVYISEKEYNEKKSNENK